MVDSCGTCDECSMHEEQFCGSGKCVFTYGTKFLTQEYEGSEGHVTQGGYTKYIVTREKFTLKIPINLDLAAAAPLLCAGITVYSPMVQHGLKPHMTLGVVGMGGLGHMAVKIGKAMGCHVTVVSRNNEKKKTCIEDLKADNFIDMSNPDEVKASAKNFNMIINTISAKYDINAYANMLKCHGKMIIVGAPPEPLQLSSMSLIFGSKTIAGSLIGGIKETQEMLDFCGQHNVLCQIEVIQPEQIRETHDRIVKGDVYYRAVIDMTKVE